MSNRVIKFRVWCSRFSKFIKPEDVRINASTGESHGCKSGGNVDSWILQQFTGLHDKNGVEIYEGDILYHKIQGKRKVIYPMHNQIAAFGLASSDGKLNTLQDSEYLYEIIGNIYENPELLESSYE